MTRAYGLLLESGLLSRTVTGQIRVLESTPKSPDAKYKEQQRKKAELLQSQLDSPWTVRGQSVDSPPLPRSEIRERDPRSEIDPEHASHALVAVATPDALDDDERTALQLEAEDTRPRKANPFYETALDVAQLHAVVFKLPGKPTREAMKPLLRCLGRNVGMTAWDCRLAVYATWADEYATDKGWTTLRHVFGDPERARQKAGVGEEARRKWYAKAAQELMEVGGQHPHPDAVKDRAATLLTMEEDRYGAASG